MRSKRTVHRCYRQTRRTDEKSERCVLHHVPTHASLRGGHQQRDASVARGRHLDKTDVGGRCQKFPNCSKDVLEMLNNRLYSGLRKTSALLR